MRGPDGSKTCCRCCYGDKFENNSISVELIKFCLRLCLKDVKAVNFCVGIKLSFKFVEVSKIYFEVNNLLLKLKVLKTGKI